MFSVSPGHCVASPPFTTVCKPLFSVGPAQPFVRQNQLPACLHPSLPKHEVVGSGGQATTTPVRSFSRFLLYNIVVVGRLVLPHSHPPTAYIILSSRARAASATARTRTHAARASNAYHLFTLHTAFYPLLRNVRLTTPPHHYFAFPYTTTHTTADALFSARSAAQANITFCFFARFTLPRTAYTSYRCGVCLLPGRDLPLHHADILYYWVEPGDMRQHSYAAYIPPDDRLLWFAILSLF